MAVTVGELHDAIEASWETAASESSSSTSSSTSSTSSSTSSPPLLHPPPPVEAKQVDDRVSLVAHPGSGIRALKIRIPSRYCSLHATTNGGDLTVEAVREAALEACTSPGGRVSLGTVRATVARVVTRGGDLSARELVADLLSVSTATATRGNERNQTCSSSVGGSASIERLVARRGSVRTGGGSLAVRSAFFGEALDLDSGGGELRLGGLTPRSSSSDGSENSSTSSSSSSSSSSPPATAVARIHSRGGTLSVEGLEGDADVDSGGGELRLHLLRGSKGLSVRARSGGAAVRAAVAPELLGSSQLVAGDGIVLLSSSNPFSSSGRMKDVSSAAAEADAALDSRWREMSSSPSSFSPPPPPPAAFAPLTPASAAAASTAGRRGGGDRLRDHGPAPATLVLIDARPGGEVSVEEESWKDAVARKAAAAMAARKG